MAEKDSCEKYCSFISSGEYNIHYGDSLKEKKNILNVLNEDILQIFPPNSLCLYKTFIMKYNRFKVLIL